MPKNQAAKNAGSTLIWVGAIIAGLLAFGLAGVFYISNEETSLPQLAKPQNSPQEIVDEFYSWYLEQARQGNSKAYQQSDLLSAEFKEEIEETRFYDPLLCAQDVPSIYEIERAEINENTARVYIKRAFGPTRNTDEIEPTPVELKIIDNKWKITDVLCDF
ncbi:MAG: hypothetical protein ACOC6Q_02590 [Patescibacteria group bacterium]